MKKCSYCKDELLTEHELSTKICDECRDYYERENDESQASDDYYYEQLEEEKAQEFWDRACNCTCGAWQNHNGETFHVADCCCGAE